MNPCRALALSLVALVVTGCGSGGGGTTAPDTMAGQQPGTAMPESPPDSTQDDPQAMSGFDPRSVSARYTVTLENFWSAEAYPQEFPDDAHLSLLAGALHDTDTLFWEFGGIVSRGMEDIAEAGLIDVFLFDEVVPAVRAGQASASIEYREYTDPMVDGVPGRSSFDIEARAGWPRLTLATMLGPSPDWFVGVSSLPLDDPTGWQESIVVDLPLLDGGTKFDIVPVMGGPDNFPREPIGYVAYDSATGTYQPSDIPQVLARLTLTRVH